MASKNAKSTKIGRNLKAAFTADAAVIASPTKYVAYAWLVVRRPSDGKYLMVLESAATPGCGGKPKYWLPAGKVDPGETLEEAAIRSCERDTHVTVEPKGLLRVMLEPGQQKGAKFSTFKAHISVSFYSFQLIFGRVIISLQVLERWMLFLTHSIAKNSS